MATVEASHVSNDSFPASRSLFTQEVIYPPLRESGSGSGINILYWNGQNLCVHQLLRLYLRVRDGLCPG